MYSFNIFEEVANIRKNVSQFMTFNTKFNL